MLIYQLPYIFHSLFVCGTIALKNNTPHVVACVIKKNKTLFVSLIFYWNFFSVKPQ